jgi:hypothetical protein
MQRGEAVRLTTPTRVLVCGGRDFDDTESMRDTLGRLHGPFRQITAIIHGCAHGADTMAGAFARFAGIDEVRFPADWRVHGKAAGPRRNQQMLDEGKPDLVVAFPGGKGTADMVRRAKAAGVKVIEVERRMREATKR